MRIKKITLDEVKAKKWKPEPHTVALRDEGEWWGLFDEDNLTTVVCISDKHNGKYFSETYTAPEYRKRGYCSLLIRFLANEVYKDDLLIAHCLTASKHCFELAGFTQYNFRNFKHGSQYFMRREASNGKAKN